MTDCGLCGGQCAGAESENEAASADVADRARHVRQEIRVSVADGRDQRTELDPFGLFGPRGERGPTFEVRSVRVAR